jgi:hypothetical protein
MTGGSEAHVAAGDGEEQVVSEDFSFVLWHNDGEESLSVLL